MAEKNTGQTNAEACERGRDMLADAIEGGEFFALFVSTPSDSVMLCTNCPADQVNELRKILIHAADQLAQKYSN